VPVVSPVTFRSLAWRFFFSDDWLRHAPCGEPAAAAAAGTASASPREMRFTGHVAVLEFGRLPSGSGSGTRETCTLPAMPMRAMAAVFGACVLWAASFLATKVALETMPPMVLVGVRLGLAAACFGCWLVLVGGPRPTREQWRMLGVLSLFGTGLHYGIQTAGLLYTTASNGALYAVTGPVTIAVFGIVVLGERLTLFRTTGLLLALVGVLAVMGPEELAAVDLRSGAAGDLMVLTSIVLWGLFTVFGKRLTEGLGAVRVTAWVTLIGAAWFAPIGLIEAQWVDFSWAGVSWYGWIAAGFLGVGCSFLATLLYFVALRDGSSQAVGAFLYTIPPMTAVAAWLWLGENLDAWFFGGAALVMLGVILTERGSPKTAPGDSP
jgi:drug/metabolite transporter (DMT)-like permease